MELCKVSSKSNSTNVAKAIYNTLKDANRLEMCVVGAGALNQAMKAVVIARGYLAPIGIDCVCIPSFMEVEIDEQIRTALKIIVQKKE